jgi:predicted nucleic acid-binding protein
LTAPKIVVHTDVFIEHLSGVGGPSVLRLALQKFFCYTTVFQAVELFSLGRNERERAAIENSMACLKVLGMNARNARRYGRLLRERGSGNLAGVLVAGLCIDSGLPLLTDERETFRGIRGLRLVPTTLVQRLSSAQEILKAARRAQKSPL